MLTALLIAGTILGAEASGTLVLTGDLMLVRSVRAPTRAQRAGVRRLLGRAHAVVGNLEGPLGPCLPGGNRYFPRLCTRRAMLAHLGALGFTAVSIANNHMLDAGHRGLDATRKAVGRAGVASSRPVAGSHWPRRCRGTEAVQLLRLRVGPYPVLLLAFNATQPRYPPLGFPAPVSPRTVGECVAHAVRAGHAVIASLHYGREYVSFVRPADLRLVEAAVRAGARVVVGHHPHVPRAAGEMGGAFVAWSLGNFASDQQDPRTQRGLALRIVLSGSLQHPAMEVRLVPFRIRNGWPLAALPRRSPGPGGAQRVRDSTEAARLR